MRKIIILNSKQKILKNQIIKDEIEERNSNIIDKSSNLCCNCKQTNCEYANFQLIQTLLYSNFLTQNIHFKFIKILNTCFIQKHILSMKPINVAI